MTGLQLRVLGAVTAWYDGIPIALGRPQQRAVLGLLALEPGVDVHRDDLIDAVWGQRPPAGAVNLIQGYVGRLRRALDPGHPPRDPSGVLVSTGRSYRLQLGADRLDWACFTDLVRRAGALVTADGGLRLYERALAMWADPLADLELPRDRRVLAAAARAWSAAVIAFGHAALAAGRPGPAVPYLRRLVDREPLNQRAHAVLVRLLAAGGQQAAALTLYGQVRRRLDEQLGLRVDAELAEAHLRVLRQDEMPAPDHTPHQLPAGISAFVGRDEELRRLDAAGSGDTVVLSAIDGAAGIGKTALAVHWAHTVAPRFPDGQLHLDLRGYDPVAPPLATAEAIRHCLDSLRVPAERLPGGLVEQIALYRTLLADRRMLVLLDNARDSDQVRPLLPRSPGCLVVVTSRRRLAGLPDAHRLSVDLFGAADARRLLAARLGEERVAAQASAVDDLIGLCAGLPLALSVAAARCAARPSYPIDALTAQLRDARQQLDALSGDGVADLRTLLWSSYQQLGPTAARLFRLLGRYPGLEVTLPAAASLAGLGRRPTEKSLAELTAAQLVTVRGSGCYGVHDLVRTYAAELAGRYDAEGTQRAAIDRVFHHYLVSLDGVDRLLHPYARPLRAVAPMPGVRPETFADPGAALAWCQRTRPTLAALIGYAAKAGPEAYVTSGRWSLWLYFHLWSHRADLDEARRVVLTDARLAGAGGAAPQPGPDAGCDPHARERYRHLVGRAQHRGEPATAAYCLFGLTHMLTRQGRHQEALVFAGYALDWFRRTGDRSGAALALNQIGRCQAGLGRIGEAAGHCEQALGICSESGDQVGEASAAASLGQLAQQRGDLTSAAGWYTRAVSTYRDAGDRDGQRRALDQLGEVRQAMGDLAGTAQCWQDALALLPDPNDPHATDLEVRLAGLPG